MFNYCHWIEENKESRTKTIKLQNLLNAKNMEINLLKQENVTTNLNLIKLQNELNRKIKWENKQWMIYW